MGVGNGEPCNWCGLYEEQAKSLDTSNELKEDKVLLTEQHPSMPWFKEG